MSLEQFIASGATALTLSLFFLWMLVTERIVPKGRLEDEKARTAQAEERESRAIAGWERQTQATDKLAVAIDAYRAAVEGRRAPSV
ncbi:MAG TPA: hypothetical protein VFC31_13015 [Candidatus Limnocylindria bacterium]|nr:hypothetical protein [Candidatus Limnocylindria bacterium]